MTAHDAHHGEDRPTERRSDPTDSGTSWLVRILMFALLAVGGYYVIAEHGAHLWASWPLLILLACPLMHFMHGGHGGHGSHAKRSDGDTTGDRNG
jgi:hypothetical protein